MQVESMMLCHSAMSQDGTLSVLGAFDFVSVPTIPYTHPACTVAIRLRFESLEAGEHKIAVTIVDADGARLIPQIVQKLNVEIPTGHSSVAINRLMNFHQSLTFAKYGDYAINLEVDDENEGSLPLSVQPVQPQPQ